MNATLAIARTADPYRDTDVIDARAPRVNQSVVGLVSLIALATGWWALLLLLAAQLAIGLTFGRRYCLPCLLYFEVIQPRLGEGPIEDSRPPRFANIVGCVFLGAASLAYALGAVALGATLAAIVAALALLAATTGLCVGCEMYRLAARIRGITSHQLERLDLRDLGTSGPLADGTVVEFTHPLCTDCHRLERELRAAGRTVIAIDVSRRSDLARKYRVGLVPTAVAVRPDGTVSERLAG